MNGQFIFRDVEINFITCLVKEHPLIVHVMSIDAEQLESDKILQKHGVFVDEEQAKNARVNEIVLAVAFFVRQACRIVSDAHEQPCVFAIFHILDGCREAEFTAYT